MTLSGWINLKGRKKVHEAICKLDDVAQGAMTIFKSGKSKAHNKVGTDRHSIYKGSTNCEQWVYEMFCVYAACRAFTNAVDNCPFFSDQLKAMKKHHKITGTATSLQVKALAELYLGAMKVRVRD